MTIGGSFGSGVPVIGNNVFIAPGVRILGEIHIGNNVILGANSVVTTDIPDNCIAMGAPAKVHKNIPPGALHALKGRLKRVELEPSET